MATKTKTTSFSQWTRQDIELTFNLKQVKESQILTDWLNTQNVTLTTDEQKRIQELSTFLADNIVSWNEFELQIHFIGPMLDLINFQFPFIRGFYQRQLSAKLNDTKVSGNVDFMIATGKDDPIQPFFCLHEYKREKGKDSDPLGQLLIEMLAAQANNKVNIPIYGIYVIGRLWFFTALYGSEYAVSKDFSATDDDVLKIFAILKNLKSSIYQISNKFEK